MANFEGANHQFELPVAQDDTLCAALKKIR
jgi:hypothetical protein